ncbi:MAG: HAMP domain-containing protein [Candidatus Riflebacteria bacterium]|nr:HAMP domain-containing protein [Candidatus Riflebacteria bacterium]
MSSSKTNKFFSFALSFALSVIPLLILIIDSKSERELTRKTSEEAWTEKAGKFSDIFRNSSKFSFWAEITAEKYSRSFSSATSTSKIDFIFSSALKNAQVKDFVKPVIWASYSNDGISFNLINQPGYSSEYKTILSRLLKDLSLSSTRKENSLDDPIVFQRIKTLFGPGITRNIFSNETRGKAFYAFYHSNFAMAIWNTLERKGKICGAFLMIFPIEKDHRTQIKKSILSNWENIFKSKNIFPAFLPMEKAVSKKYRPAFHPKIRCSETRSLLSEIAAFLKLTPPDKSSHLGIINFPEFKNYSTKHFRAIPCVLDPRLAELGILFSKKPSDKLTQIEIWKNIYLLLFIVFWTFFSISKLTNRISINLTIRQSLFLWFLSLTLPVFIIILNSGKRLEYDLSVNLKAALDKKLTAEIRKVEAEASIVNSRFHNKGREITNWLSKELENTYYSEKLKYDKNFESYLKMSIEERLEKQNFQLDAAMLFSEDEKQFVQFADTVNPDSRKLTEFIYHAFSMEYLDKALFKGTKTVNENKDASFITKLGVLEKNDSLQAKPDTIQRMGQTNSSSMRYTNLVQSKGNLTYLLHIISNLNNAVIHSMSKYVKTLNYSDPDFFLALVRSKDEKYEILCQAGNSQTLINLNREVRGEFKNERFGERRIIISRPNEGISIIAGASLEPIMKSIQKEVLWIYSGIILSALFTGIFALILSNWLVKPLTGMINSLKKIEKGDLSTRLIEERQDELGFACKNLDIMRGWLSERQIMSKFVPPDVLKVVSDGDLDNAVTGTRRILVTLVSDVRSFTTLSEAHSPPEVFDMINVHLKAMTKAINDNGGTVDRFIGDAIQAIFCHAHEEKHEHIAIRAIKAAQMMMKSHHEINRAREKSGLFTYKIGVGIDIGEVITGVMGDKDTRLDFSVLGDTMKIANELEAASKKGRHSGIVCSTRIAEIVNRHYSFEEIYDSPGCFELKVDTIADSYKSKESESNESKKSEDSEDNTSSASNIENQIFQEKLTQEENLLPYAHSENKIDKKQTNYRRWFFTAIFLFLPLFFMLFSFKFSENSYKSGISETIERQLIQDLNHAARSKDPSVQISIFFKRFISSVFDNFKIPTGKIENISENDVKSINNKLLQCRKTFPSLDWCLTSISSEPKLILNNQSHTDFDKKFLRLLSIVFHNNLLRQSSTWELKKTILYNLKLTPDEIVKKSLDQFLLLDLSDHPVYFFWSSILLPDGKPGIILLFLHPEDMTGKNRKKALISNFKNSKCTILYDDATEFPGNSAALSPISNKLISKSLKTDNGEVISAIRERSSNYDKTLSQQRKFLIIISFIWIFTGISAAKRMLGNKSGVKISLKYQMAGAFVFSIIPTLVCAYFSLERGNIERTFLTQYKEEKRIQQTSSNAEKFEDMFLSYTMANIFKHENSKFLLDKIHRLRKASKKDRKKLTDELSSSLINYFYNRGILIGRNTLAGPEGFSVDLEPGQSRENDIQFQFIQSTGFKSLSGLGASYSEPGTLKNTFDPSTFIDYGVEEMNKLLLFVSSPEEIAESGHSPNLFSPSLPLDDQKNYILGYYINENGKPLFLFRLSLKSNSIHKNNFIQIEKHNLLAPGRHVKAFLRAFPNISYKFPFWKTELEKLDRTVDLEDLYEKKPSDEHELSLIANESNMPAFKMISENNDDEILKTTIPGLLNESLIYSYTTSIGKFISEASSGTETQKSLLAVLLLFSILLAFNAASGFILPVSELVFALKRFMQKDFSIRLDPKYGGEFSQLAIAYNSVAKSVAEGKLLMKFVSESVRSAARDKDREEAARKGELIQTTVMFIGVANFKKVISGMSPEKLIFLLNRHLEKVSKIIRNHGGEIDKFIGDKVLATFPHSTQGGIEKASSSAIIAASEICKTAFEISENSKQPIGAGIVTGPVLAGIIGTGEAREDYTVIGDTVNLASRLGELSFKLSRGGQIASEGEREIGGIVMETLTYESAKKINTFENTQTVSLLDLPPIKGKTRTVTAYSLLADSHR